VLEKNNKNLCNVRGDLSLLEKLYRNVLVPFEVYREIEAGGDSAFGIGKFRKADFIKKEARPLPIAPYLANSLDLGEAAVIQLAINKNIDTVCIDEAVGRRVARLNGLNLTGSIGILIRAKRSGMAFSMKEAIKRMEARGVFLSQTVIRFALAQVDDLK